MTTIELQNKIIRKILSTQDNQLLDYLNNILSEEKDDHYVLSEFEQKFIQESLADYQRGETKPNSEVNSKIEKWLKE